MSILFLTMVLALPAGKPAAPNPTLVSNAKIIALLQSLHELTPQRMTDQQLQAHIRRMIEPLELGDVGRFALLARAMSSGMAEDERIDLVYWSAFWVCAHRVAERNDEDSVWVLQYLNEHGRLGGAEKMLMRELIKRQSAVGKTKPKR